MCVCMCVKANRGHGRGKGSRVKERKERDGGRDIIGVKRKPKRKDEEIGGKA